MACTPQYNLLPDLGMYIRGILQRRFYTECIRKNLVKTASVHNDRATMHHGAAAAVLSAKLKSQWRFMHGPCANLLIESIPCMKKIKRSVAFSSYADSSQQQQQQCICTDAVEIAACINVMHGTLLKLYPLGAKTPTFDARCVLYLLWCTWNNVHHSVLMTFD